MCAWILCSLVEECETFFWPCEFHVKNQLYQSLLQLNKAWSAIHVHTSGLIASLKLKESGSATKRPFSKDNASWAVNYLSYCHNHISFLSFSFSFKPARKLSTTPWKAQDIPITIFGIWIATSPFPFPWERTCESPFKSSSSIPSVGAAGKWLEMI